MPGNPDEVELVAIVVVRQSRNLLNVLRTELQFGFGPKAQMFLASGDKGLFKPAADRLPRVQNKAILGCGKQSLRKWRPQPLKLF